LFVAKGGTRYVESRKEKAPQAASLAWEMKRNPSHLKVQKPPKKEAPKRLKNGKQAKSVVIRSENLKITKVSRPVANTAFAPGERLKFEVRALSILGGYATLEVGDYTTVEGRPCTPLTARANTVFPMSAIYPVKDVQTSFFDTVDFLSWKFQNNVLEGNYKSHNVEKYDQVRHRLVRQHNDEAPLTLDIAPFSQDIISCFYYFRLLPLEEGKTYSIPTQSGGKNYELIVRVDKKETITVPAGTFDCLRVKPLIKSETVFRNNEEIDLWVTADSRHIPVKIKSGILIGSIDVDLLEASLPQMAMK
jgi:hypothetical protein